MCCHSYSTSQHFALQWQLFCPQSCGVTAGVPLRDRDVSRGMLPRRPLLPGWIRRAAVVQHCVNVAYLLELFRNKYSIFFLHNLCLSLWLLFNICIFKVQICCNAWCFFRTALHLLCVSDTDTCIKAVSAQRLSIFFQFALFLFTH